MRYDWIPGKNGNEDEAELGGLGLYNVSPSLFRHTA
jgi:hypothetical protein